MAALTPDATATMAEKGTHEILTMKKIDGKPGQVWYPLQIQPAQTQNPSSSQILLRPTHLSLNHRDLFLRKHLYPSPSFTTPLISDAVCIPLSPSSSPQSPKRYLLNPAHGWSTSPSAPEGPFAILGGTSTNPLGCAQTRLVVDKAETAPCPTHLTGAEAAALPLAGLTAWRALVTKSGAAEEGKKILITGIGGGVALMVLQFAVKMGVRCWVSSSSTEKLEKAKKLGADGGVIYEGNKDWDKEVRKMVGGEVDAIIDGAGGEEIGGKAVRLVRQGGVVVCYGMTVKPTMSVPMGLVLKNVEVRGSTMGSRREFRDMVRFVGERGIRPVVSKTVRGRLGDLEKWEELFEEMRGGRQMGKLVFEVVGEGEGVKGKGGGIEGIEMGGGQPMKAEGRSKL